MGVAVMEIRAYSIYDRIELVITEPHMDISIEIDTTTAEEAMFALKDALDSIRKRKLDV